jgi:phosphatidylglycerophosphate synthase
MKKILEKTVETLCVISQGRHRTNLLKRQEQRVLAFLVCRIPACITSDMLTAFGFLGGLITFLSFILALYVSRYLLLLGVLGFLINWFGDSLDGRVAYYRNASRRWYGFSLDITVDWVTTILIGYGFVIYAKGIAELLGFFFVVMYGWEMITTLLRYKITGKYSIDCGVIGPTEVRIIISIILIMEVFVQGSIIYFAMLACASIFVSNLLETVKLLKAASMRDQKEKEDSLTDSHASR